MQKPNSQNKSSFIHSLLDAVLCSIAILTWWSKLSTPMVHSCVSLLWRNLHTETCLALLSVCFFSLFPLPCVYNHVLPNCPGFVSAPKCLGPVSAAWGSQAKWISQSPTQSTPLNWALSDPHPDMALNSAALCPRGHWWAGTWFPNASQWFRGCHWADALLQSFLKYFSLQLPGTW